MTSPPRKGDFFVFEVKSTLGALENPPGLSRAQADPVEFTTSRLGRALEGDKGYPMLDGSDLGFLVKVINASAARQINYRKIDIRMNHAGSLSAVGGKKEMEIRSWQ